MIRRIGTIGGGLAHETIASMRDPMANHLLCQARLAHAGPALDGNDASIASQSLVSGLP